MPVTTVVLSTRGGIPQLSCQFCGLPHAIVQGGPHSLVRMLLLFAAVPTDHTQAASWPNVKLRGVELIFGLIRL